MSKEILALGRKYNELELAIEFYEKGKTVEEFQNALIEKKSSSGFNSDVGEIKELSKFKFGEYALEQVNKTPSRMTAFANELTQTYGQGIKAHGGVHLPRKLVNELRLKHLRAAGGYSLGVDVAGGNTASLDYRTDLIDALYNKSVWRDLATAMPSASGFGSVSYPLITAKNNVEMIGEGVVPATTRQEFANILFTPKQAKATTKVTREILKTSSLPAFESVAMNGLVKAMADKRNQQFVNGTGANGEILGVFNASGTQVVAMGTNGARMDFERLVDMETLAAVQNAELGRCSYLTNSKVAGKLKTIQQFPNFGGAVLTGGQANGYDVFITNEVRSNYTKGTGTNLSAAAFVNPEYIYTVEWDVVEFFVNPFIEEDGSVRINAYDMFDMQIMKPELLTLCKDIVT